MRRRGRGGAAGITIARQVQVLEEGDQLVGRQARRILEDVEREQRRQRVRVEHAVADERGGEQEIAIIDLGRAIVMRRVAGRIRVRQHY